MAPSYPPGTPSIASIALIGRQNQPLHISTFPTTPSSPARTTASLHWHLLHALDVLRVRFAADPPADGNFGLLFASDERLAVYGFVSPTGVRFIVVVDMEGKAAPERESLEGGRGQAWNVAVSAAGQGIKDADLKVVWRALQQAYVALLRNPFFEPDACEVDGQEEEEGNGSGMIRSRAIEKRVERVGRLWYPGIPML